MSDVKERRAQFRRKIDKEMFDMATESANVATAAKVAAEQSMALLRSHVDECAKQAVENTQKLTTLEQTVKPLSDYWTAKTLKEQKRAEILESVADFLLGALKEAFKGVFGRILQVVMLAAAALAVGNWFNVSELFK